MKLLMGCQAVMLCLGAVVLAPSSASAAAETRFFIEGAEVKGSEEATIEGNFETIGLSSVIAATKVSFICTSNKFSEAKIKAGGAASSKLEFAKCKAYEIKEGAETLLSSCTISEPVSFAVKEQLISGPGGVAELEVKPSTGTSFTSIVLSGATCIFKGTFELQGSLSASLPEGEIESTIHSLVVDSTGSKLTLGKEKAALVAQFPPPPPRDGPQPNLKLSTGKSFRG
ncbi:MAG: hypothetical protein ABSH36_10495 [Solirubrobacteraceae bacterium]